MRILLLSLAIAAVSCSASRAPASPSDRTSPIRVLMLTATAGFRHDSIATARQVMSALATTTHEFSVTATENMRDHANTLAGYDVLFFALTSGELPFTPDQKSAILGFVAGGRGFVGVHSASDTLHDWSEYGRLVGASFVEHPWTQRATVVVEDTTHPATAGLGDRFTLTEEFYVFDRNPRASVHVLLRLDAASSGRAATIRSAGSSRSARAGRITTRWVIFRDAERSALPGADRGGHPVGGGRAS